MQWRIKLVSQPSRKQIASRRPVAPVRQLRQQSLSGTRFLTLGNTTPPRQRSTAPMTRQHSSPAACIQRIVRGNDTLLSSSASNFHLPGQYAQPLGLHSSCIPASGVISHADHQIDRCANAETVDPDHTSLTKRLRHTSAADARRRYTPESLPRVVLRCNAARKHADHRVSAPGEGYAKLLNNSLLRRCVHKGPARGIQIVTPVANAPDSPGVGIGSKAPICPAA